MPRTLEGGKLKTVGPKDWTSGFFPGTLWYLSEATGDAKWKPAAVEYTRRLESIKDFRSDHPDSVLHCVLPAVLSAQPDFTLPEFVEGRFDARSRYYLSGIFICIWR